MRFNGTFSEQVLWSALRGCQLGVAFRRQAVVMGRFIVDFLAPGPHLAVEVDGGYHASRRRADVRRDEALRCLGYRVLRLEGELAERDLPAAVARIREELARLVG